MVYQPDPPPINLSLCGCGFLGVYHVGVICAFKEHAPAVLNGNMAGCSAGSLVAACAMSGCCLGQMCSDALEIAIRARSRALGPLHPTFSIVDIIRNGLRRILPPNAHEICSGRLHISLTRWKDNKNVIISQFASREELIQVLICSSFVPYWSGIIPPKVQDIYYWDGGLTNNNPIINNGTILISPFAGESDICPRDESGSFYSVDFRGTDILCTQENLYRMTHALFPPSVSILKKICENGYEDALKFLRTRNMVNSSYLSTRVIISSVLGREYTEPDNEDEKQLRDGGIGQNVAQMYENVDDLEEESVDDEDGSSGSSRETDEESNAASSQATFAPYCEQIVRRKELPTTLFAAFADAKQKEEYPIHRYFTDSNFYKVCSYMALPFTLPIDLTYTATKRVLGSFRPSSDTDQSSMPKRAVNYLWSFFGDENNEKYCFHVNDCECQEKQSKRPTRSRKRRSSNQLNSNKATLNRKRQMNTGISTVTSYRTDSSSDNEATSTINNDDTAYFLSEPHLHQRYPQPTTVMSVNSTSQSQEYCHQLQKMADLLNRQRFDDQTSSTTSPRPLFDNNNSYMTGEQNEFEIINHETIAPFD